MILIEHVLERLHDSGMLCTVQRPAPYGIQLRLSNGAVANIYNTGKILAQGKQADEVRRVLGLSPDGNG